MVCADLCSNMHVCTYVLNNHEHVYWQLMARHINFWKFLMLLRAYPPAYGRAVASAHVAHPVALSSQTIIIDDPADELTDRELFEQMLADKTADLWDDVWASVATCQSHAISFQPVSCSFNMFQNIVHIVSEHIVQCQKVS